MSPISANLQAVTSRIAALAQAAGRPPGAIQLVAVSKQQPVGAILEALAAGQYAFGENYLQEALAKQAQLPPATRARIEWHFIGPIQSNKTGAIARNFAWVHGVDRLKIAERLARDREGQLPLNVCVQVNVSGEASKSGVAPDATLELARAVTALPSLRLRGLMTVIEAVSDIEQQRRQFRVLCALQEVLNAHGMALDTLSMGMSQDFPAAIAEGSTLLRLGSAIFGARPARAPPASLAAGP